MAPYKCILLLFIISHSSHHSQEVLLAQFSLYVHKSGKSPIHFIFLTGWFCLAGWLAGYLVGWLAGWLAG